MQIIPQSSYETLKEALRSICGERVVNGSTIPVASGAVVVPNVVRSEAARSASSTLFTRGADLTDALGAVVLDEPVREVVVGDLDAKFALFHGLRQSLDAVIMAALGPRSVSTELQARVYDGGRIGHPRHKDEQSDVAPAGDKHGDWLTSVSTSIPISLPMESEIQFLMHIGHDDIVQSGVGSVAFFGPLVEHTTPVREIGSPAIWLTALSIIRFDA